jgi:endonuclease VIII
MPEGHSIKLMADKLRGALEGEVITSVRGRYRKYKEENWGENILGQTVTEIRSHGKNLFIDLSNDYSIYSHMMMWGSWHVYAPGQEWDREEYKGRLVLETAKSVAVLFSAPVCELISRDELPQHKTARIGPDLLAPNFDKEEVWLRLNLPEHGDLELGEAIMNQVVLSGIGNILKSEILFQAGLHPKRAAGSLSPGEFDRFIAYSRELIQRSYELGGFSQAFLPPELLPEQIRSNTLGYVYRRRTKPCYVCATPIEMTRQGIGKRMTWYCPTCQPMEGDTFPIDVRQKIYAKRAAG